MNGAVIFAQNNGIIDYSKLAYFCATRIKKYLDLPVSIITDNAELFLEYPKDTFESIIKIPYENCTQKLFYDGTLSSKKVEWKNTSRNRVYELTPYQKTLVIDSDFIINSSKLKQAFDRDALFQIYHNSFDLSQWRKDEYFTRVNPYSVPFYWATAFVFEKHPVMECFFTLVNYIKENWSYFKVLYNIDSVLYRNDYSFSIAIHIMNGKTNGEFATELPGKMTYILEQDYLIDMNDTDMQFLIQKPNSYGEYLAVKTSGIDVHVMNKMSLSRFIDGGIGV